MTIGRTREAAMVETISRSPAALTQAIGRLSVDTPGVGTTDITPAIEHWIAALGAGDGLLTVFCRHTSASITVQENSDPDVHRDLVDALARLAPEDAGWRHSDEGADDMPAHVKAVLTGTSLSLPVVGGRPALGTWQAIYLVEHRRRPHRRTVALHLLSA